MANKKGTHFRFRWMIDADYRKKLSPQELAFLEKFEDEYYRGQFSEDPLHGPDHRKSIYDAQNASWTDIVTQTGDEIARARAKRPKNGFTYYSPDDYPQEEPADTTTANQLP